MEREKLIDKLCVLLKTETRDFIVKALDQKIDFDIKKLFKIHKEAGIEINWIEVFYCQHVGKHDKNGRGLCVQIIAYKLTH